MTETPTRPHPTPLSSLTASARRLTSKTLGSRVGATTKGWQDDAWEMFGLVGELHFLAVTLAGRMSQARLYVGKMSTDPTEAPVPVEDPNITKILDSVGASASARSQMIARLGVNLFVAGDGWLVGIPKRLIPESLMVGPLNDPSLEELDPELMAQMQEPDTSLLIEDLEWRMLSVSEVIANSGGEVEIKLGETEDERLRVKPDDIVLIRVWRPHPRYWWQADAPVRSSLPVLRELVGLTMHISAQVDSRLAGAGVLIVPQSAQRALQQQAGVPEGDPDTADQFTPALMEAMLTPISDRANASAVVPLVITVPDESAALFRHLTFDKALDIEARNLRDEAIRRLALGLDAPPELLLGTGGMNHWGAWLVLEDVVTTHLEPPLAVICDALTTQFLWPVLAEQGMAPETAQDYVIWYDVSDLVVRPTRGADSHVLHTAGVISDEAYRAANAFDESDAPFVEASQPLEVTIALDLIAKAPALMSNPGLPQLVAQIKAVLAGDIPDVLDPAAAVRSAEERTTGAVPSAANDTTQAPPIAKGPQAPGSPAAIPSKGPQAPAPDSQAASAAPVTVPMGLELLRGLLVPVDRA